MLEERLGVGISIHVRGGISTKVPIHYMLGNFNRNRSGKCTLFLTDNENYTQNNRYLSVPT